MIALRLRFAFRLFVAALICAPLLLLFSLQVRYTAAVAGLLPVPQAHTYTWADGAPVAIGSSGTITVSYCSEVVAFNDPKNPAGLTSTSLEWDDAWFMSNSHNYNHDIATASAVLSAVSNSESQFYGSVEGAAPYAEQALGQLGFSAIQTESYALRSHTLDQIGALFAGSHDVAAYTLASKPLVDAAGKPQGTLVFVGIRGSYGIEWLSNLKIVNFTEDTPDHLGFKTAEREVMEALSRYVEAVGIDASTAKFLITGHSRGGSIANLLAAELCRQEGQSEQNRSGEQAEFDGLSKELPSLVSDKNVFTYTFAAPGTTLSLEQGDKPYSNIFNIVNPTDIVPQLPLAAWGYGRYGTLVSLPDVRDDEYLSSYTAMQAAFSSNTGFTNPLNAAAQDNLDSFGAHAGNTFPSALALMTPMGMLSVGQSLMNIDYGMALASHYPDTYIAWMQSIDSSELTFS